MNIYKKHIALLGAALLLIAMPAVAQIEGTVTFDAPFAFYAGDAKMPAGTYRVTQPDATVPVLLIQDAANSAFVRYMPVDKVGAASQAKVSFTKYGDLEFLSRISLAGQNSEFVISQSEAEENAASAAAAQEHSLPATSNGTQPAMSTDSQPESNN